MSFILSGNSNNCCLLYFNANIMCSFTKSFSFWGAMLRLPDPPHRGSAPGPHWGTSGPQTSSLLLSPNNPVRWTRLPLTSTCHIQVSVGTFGSTRMLIVSTVTISGTMHKVKTPTRSQYWLISANLLARSVTRHRNFHCFESVVSFYVGHTS